MVTQIPYIYVNILALCCFSLLFVALMASRKSPAIWAFILVLGNCILWSGGSILMRLQMWPGMNFWYYLSLTALFIMEFLFYRFVNVLYRQKKKAALLLTGLGTAAIIPGTVSGFFLAPPTPLRQADGSMAYLYEISWPLMIPCALFTVIIAMTVALFARLVREQGIRSPGLLVIISGGLVMFVGNLLQVSVPGNTFPYDALAGVVFAVLLTCALYRRRMFQMTLMISRSILMALLVLLCIGMSAYLINPLQSFAERQLHVSPSTATVLAALAFSGFLALTYCLLRRMIDAIFTREERQGRQIKQFSGAVTQSLNTGEIMDKLMQAALAETEAELVYICQRTEGGYAAKCCSNPLAMTEFSIAADSPLLTYLKQESYLIPGEFQSSSLYLSMWESEKELLRRLNIGCIVAIRDSGDVVGLLLLSSRDRRRKVTLAEITYLETLCSVASIAIKNAGLYEKMFQEARIDVLTGCYNYRYFAEREAELFEACREDCLSLMFADVDDFKLYNQLYGVEAGDEVLCCVSRAIGLCVGTRGEIFRTSGKVFGILLPHTDTHGAKTMAEEICRRVREINRSPDRRKYKSLSVSIGICTAPHAAASAKELMDNADLAAYMAKQDGKDRISVFREAGMQPRRLSERTELIVERIERGEQGKGAFDMIAALTAAIDAKDHYTFNHSKNVARYAASLAVAIGLNEEQVRTIYAAGLLHDIGKISIPEVILQKTDRLTDPEYSVMKGHVNNSIEMIRHLPDMDYLIPAVLGHHERWDGKGYPRGISGAELPVSARCLSVADAFDAMVTDRPYRRGLPVEYAVAQVRAAAGTQFDPDLASTFAELIESRSIPLGVRA